MTRDDEPDRGTDPRGAEPHTAAAADAADTVEAVSAAVSARAAAGGYAMVGPSARTWSVNTDTDIPVGPVGQAEHRLVRDLIAQERLDGAEPVWLPCTDGSQEIVAAVVMGPTADVDDLDCGDAEDRDEYAAGRDEHPPGQTRPANDAATVDAVTGMPAQMLDGIETRRTGPAERDDPAALQARLDDLRARIAAAVGEPAGGWRTVSARAAAQQLARRGTDPAAARAMVGDYLRETSERAGAPAWEWGLDQGDIDAIASAHDLPAAAIRAVAEQEDTQTVRAAQLSHWHTDGVSDGADARRGSGRLRCVSRRRVRRRDGVVAVTPPAVPPAVPPVVPPAPGSPPSPDAGGVVAGLAREIDQLRRAVEPLLGLPDRVDDLTRLVADLTTAVAALTARKAAQPCPSWLLLPADPALAAALLDELTGWLQVVYLRYPDAADHLPECWCWHPDVVEELLWLMHAWAAAYQGPQAGVALVGDWHDRQRSGVVRRIKTTAGSCSIENHQSRTGWTRRPSGPPAVPGVDSVAAIADWWGARRDQDAPQPPPRLAPLDRLDGRGRR